MTLREARKQKGWTQAELADILGVSSITISLLEKNKVVASRRTRYRLHKIFGDKIDLYVRQQSLIDMISDYVGGDVERANKLRTHIARTLEANRLDVINCTTAKNKQS